ncbi:hypothetical protein CD006_09695 [Enterobacter sp. 10-1]|nr:hypothetical protein CD006_09695 [Enterobacter sp. 10-1]
MRFNAGVSGLKNLTIRVPEVLIGEFVKYAFRTDYLAPACADAQVFFILKILPHTAFKRLLV